MMNSNNNQQVPADTAGLMSMSDSEDSSSSSNAQIFANSVLVLELHELQRDELPDNPLPEQKKLHTDIDMPDLVVYTKFQVIAACRLEMRTKLRLYEASGVLRTLKVQTRRLSKKRTKRGTEQDVASLSSSTESLVLSTGQPGSPTEEYFDAQGSNPDLSENGLEPSSLDTESDQDRSRTIPPPPSQADPRKTTPASQVSAAIIPAPALSAATAAQLNATTTSKQSDDSKSAQQHTGPLSKPTESSKP